jgi:hypothetical protein
MRICVCVCVCVHIRTCTSTHKHARLTRINISLSRTPRADEQLAVLEEELEAMSDGTTERILTYGNKPATENEILAIAELRVNIAQLTAADEKELGKWLTSIENVEILRFLRVHATPDKTWQALRTTAKVCTLVCMYVCMYVYMYVDILRFLRVHAIPDKTWQALRTTAKVCTLVYLYTCTFLYT